MEYVTLGRTGLHVSRLAFGTWQLGGDWGPVDEREAIAAIWRARDLGINLFDTAQAYGFGASERLLGRALREELRGRRDEIVIATKGGLRRCDHGVTRDGSRASLRAGVEDSLQSLGVDYIDLYQVHWPDPSVPFEETAGYLHELVDAGKLRHVGVSNFDVAQMDAFSRTRPVETLQPPYHLFRRKIEREILPYCAEHDIGVLVYGPLAHGLLTGAIRPHVAFARGDWRRQSGLFRGRALQRNLETVRVLDAIARQRGRRVGQLAIAWTLANPAVHVAIVGSRRAAHVDDAVGALDLRLDCDDLACIDAVVANAVAVAGPSPEMV
jgi:aryl-alcohol dehydrogenase-like predicted oxidoreductase